MNENCIEWLRDKEVATVTLCQRRMITKVFKLSEEHPQECEICAENLDGSIVAHIPVRWIKISPTRKTSEEQKEKARERLMQYHNNKREKNDE